MNTIPKHLQIARREFTTGTLALGTAVAALGLQAQDAAGVGKLGPIVGPVDPTSAMIWMRVGTAGEYVLEATAKNGGEVIRISASAAEEFDLCVRWLVKGLQPATKY